MTEQLLTDRERQCLQEENTWAGGAWGDAEGITTTAATVTAATVIAAAVISTAATAINSLSLPLPHII